MFIALFGHIWFEYRNSIWQPKSIFVVLCLGQVGAIIVNFKQIFKLLISLYMVIHISYYDTGNDEVGCVICSNPYG